MCVGLPVSARHGTVVPRRRPPADFYCWYPPSTPVCWLSDSGGQVRSTRRSTLGDRAFAVAAARGWNSLPPAVRDAPSLLFFRSRLKTWLFELTLAWHWLHSLAALHFVCDFSNSVKCPCNVTHDSVTLIFTFLIITRGQSNLTKSASRGAHSPVRGHPRGSKFVPLNSWGRGSY